MANVYYRSIIVLFLFYSLGVSAEQLNFDEEMFKNSLKPAAVFKNKNTDFKLFERMKYYGASAVSIVVIKNNNFVFTKAFGSLSKNCNTPVNEQSLFQAASLSKAITALAIMHLRQTLNLPLDEPLNNYLQSWQLEGGQSVTLRQLLSHTAGVNNTSYQGYEPSTKLPNLLNILNGTSESNKVSVVSSKGKYKYSGGGYMIVQQLIEDITKRNFSEYMRSEFFAKFSAKQSHFDVIKYSKEKNIAKGHGFSGNMYPNSWFNYPQKAAAGLWSTPTDLANLLAAYMKSYQGVDNRMISIRSAKEITTVIDSKMGLGFGVHSEGINLHIDHGGWTKGYRAYMTAFPERGDAVVVMANSNNSNRLIEEIMRSISNQLDWDAYKSQTFDLANWEQTKIKSFAGTYMIEPAGFSVEMIEHGDYFEMNTPRGTTHQLYPISENALVMIEDGTLVNVLDNGNLSFWGLSAIKR